MLPLASGPSCHRRGRCRKEESLFILSPISLSTFLRMPVATCHVPCHAISMNPPLHPPLCSLVMASPLGWAHHRAFHVVTPIPYNRDPYAESLNEASHAAFIHSLLSELGMYSSFLVSVQYSSFASAQVHCSRQFCPINRLAHIRASPVALKTTLGYPHCLTSS